MKQKLYFYRLIQLKKLFINLKIFLGWCVSTRECLPGSIDGCYCENACPPVSFYDTELKCDHIESSGTLSNIDPYATKFVDAQIIGPKFNITTIKVYPDVDNFEVKQGEKVERKEILAYNAAENRLVSDEINLVVPAYSKIPMEIVKIERDTKSYNASTGGEIMPEVHLGLFGK